MEITIVKMGINGEGIGYQNRKPVFVDGVFPEEVVDIKIIESKNTYMIGQCEKIIKRSPYRKATVCRSRTCRACALVEMAYEEQLRQKRLLLTEALYKYAQIRESAVDEVTLNPSPLGYRNLLKLPVKTINGRLVCGMFEPNSNRFNEIDRCVIHDPRLDSVKQAVLDVLNAYHLHSYDPKMRKGVRFVVIRGFSDGFQCALITGNDELSDALCDDLIQIDHLTSLYQGINTTKRTFDVFEGRLIHKRGGKTIELKMDRFIFRLSPKAFFQLNVKQAENLYRYVASQIDGANLVLEAYCGIGGISLFVSDKAQRVIGIENNRESVRDAKDNARLNKIRNCEFICEDAAIALKRIGKNEMIDVLIVDPPRSGLSDEMVESIQRSKIEKLIYVSCNPSTLAKNLADLSRFYDVESIRPFDMFSYTPLVEAVVTLVRK